MKNTHLKIWLMGKSYYSFFLNVLVLDQNEPLEYWDYVFYSNYHG